MIMAETEEVIVGIDSAAAMVEQLCKTLDELGSHSNSSLCNKTPWEDVKEHFRNLEKSFKKKVEEVELKEKAFQEKLAETHVLLAGKEAAITEKEHALLDRLQVLKDNAVAAVAEGHRKWKALFPGPVYISGSKENKLSTSTNGETNAPIPAQEGKVSKKLKQLCGEMDARGLLKFILKHQNNVAVIRKKLPIALKSANEPAQLVLDSLAGFYWSDPNSKGSKGVVFRGLRNSRIVLMQSATSLLGMAEPGSSHLLSLESKQQARAIANEWKPKVVDFLEAHAFLQLLVTFGIGPDFDEDELCKVVIIASHRGQAPELCRNLGLTHRVPGIIEALIDSQRHIDAVHFAHAFQLTEKFPPVPLLKAYLQLKTTPRANGLAVVYEAQRDESARELAALKAIIGCIEEHKLQGEYPLLPLKGRLAHLEREKANKKRKAEESKLGAEKAQANAGYATGPSMLAAPAIRICYS